MGEGSTITNVKIARNDVDEKGEYQRCAYSHRKNEVADAAGCGMLVISTRYYTHILHAISCFYRPVAMEVAVRLAATRYSRSCIAYQPITAHNSRLDQ